jgi:hypothetical protein
LVTFLAILLVVHPSHNLAAPARVYVVALKDVRLAGAMGQPGHLYLPLILLREIIGLPIHRPVE